MCGIAGLISGQPVEDSLDRVKAATAALSHRGPDGEGFFFEPPGESSGVLVTRSGDVRVPPVDGSAPAARGIVLGHRRLAIIDPTSAGAQPMVSADGRYVLVLNGEIYNHVELRKQLVAAGVGFHSASDTEVLLAGYAQWGVEILNRVVGMFAMALLDRLERTVLLARDCFGIKPLYYATGPAGIGFASEPEAVMGLLGLSPRADVDGLFDFVAHGLTDHRPSSMFVGVHAVPPASYLRFSLVGRPASTPVRYWTPDPGVVDDRPAATIARDLRERFLTSIEWHVRADEGVGALLSGGIDSSAIVMAMREVGGAHLEIQTFSYVAADGAISEEPWIDVVNAAAGAVPHKVHLVRDAWETAAGGLMRRQGEPYGTLAVYAQSELHRSAAEHGVRVILDGQGADEIFAGYGAFRGVRTAAHLRRLEISQALRFAGGLKGSASWRDAIVSREVFNLLCPAPLSAVARRIAGKRHVVSEAWFQAHGVRPGSHSLQFGRRLLQERLRDAIERTSLPALLRYADRSSMMHGVESRFPFLTRDLVEFALRLPDHLLVSNDGLGKAILRDAMRGIVPDVVLDRRDKIGFAVPLREWLLGSRYARDKAAAACALPCVDGRRVEPWLQGLAAGRVPDGRATFLVWRLVGLGEWMCGNPSLLD